MNRTITQGDTQDVPQDGTQDVPQDNELDDWIEKQLQNIPQISTDDSAELSNRSSKTTVAICDSGFYDSCTCYNVIVIV